MHRVTAAVVTYQAKELVGVLADTLKLLPDVNCVIYDSASSDGTDELLKKMIPEAEVINGENRGFGYGNNRCLENIDTEYTLLLNSDARITVDSLGVLLKFLDDNPSFAGVQPLIRLWNWKQVTVSRGVFLTGYGEAWDSGFMHLEPFVGSTPFEVPAITAAVSLWRTSVIKSLGGFDQGFFMYFEDADLSLRAQTAGWKLAVAAGASAEHMVGASSTRMEASLWELSSSVRIYRRYLSRRTSIMPLVIRELRVLLGSIIHRRNPFPRLKAFISASRNKVTPVELPASVESVLFGSPSDLPMPRSNSSLSGPGWRGSVVSPWAGVRVLSDSVSVNLKSTGHAVTGAFLGIKGDMLQRFAIPAGGSRLYRLAVPDRVVYIKCDMDQDEVKADIE